MGALVGVPGNDSRGRADGHHLADDLMTVKLALKSGATTDCRDDPETVPERV